MIQLHPNGKQLFTIQDLIDAGFPLDAPFELQDPDTDWGMSPAFNLIDGSIVISGDYDQDRRLDW